MPTSSVFLAAKISAQAPMLAHETRDVLGWLVQAGLNCPQHPSKLAHVKRTGPRCSIDAAAAALLSP